MKLTRQTDYALRVLMFCAANGNNVTRVSDVAQAYDVSQPFIFKLLQRLVRAGIVETTRGRNGGIMLGRAAAEISIGEVVRLMEESLEIAECFDPTDTDCPLLNNCLLKNAFRDALNAFLDKLDAVTIDDLAKPSAAVGLLFDEINRSSTKSAPR
jgi:Rrf2 family iron-responsive transcriptional regulator